MERNQFIDCLTLLFNEVSINGIYENILEDIEAFLILCLDNEENNFIFNFSPFYQFVLLLKRQDKISRFLRVLLDEIEMKSIRLYYQNSIESKDKFEPVFNEVLPTFTNIKLPEKGKYKICTQRDGGKMIYYKVDSTGRAIEKIKEEINPLIDFNNSALSEIYENTLKNQKINENDL